MISGCCGSDYFGQASFATAVNEDARYCLASIANRRGAESMTASTWANMLSLELGWCNPSQAASFIGQATANGLLLAKGDELAMSFPRSEVKIPRGFRWQPGSITESDAPTEPSSEASPFITVVDRIAAAKGSHRRVVLDAVAKMQDRFGGKMQAEAAAILVALEAGIDIADDAKAGLARIQADAVG